MATCLWGQIDPSPFPDGGESSIPTTPPQAPVYTISDIRVEGVKSTTSSAVIAFSGLRIGDKYRVGSDLIEKGIRNLYQRKIFSDVKVFAEPVGPTSIALTIQVVEYPRVGDITFNGNDELDDDDLTDALTFTTGDIATPNEYQRSEGKIKALYREKGYLFSSVTITPTTTSADDRINVLVSVSEGPEVKVGTVRIEGTSALDEDDVKGAMKDVEEKSWWQFWKSSKLKEEKLKEDENRIVDYYRSRGFVDAEIIRDTVIINPISGKSDIIITVSEGRQLYLRNLTIAGNSVYDTTVIRSLLRVKTGEAYDQFGLEDNLLGSGEQSVRSFYLDRGYLTFNADISEQRVSGDSVDAFVRIVEGAPAYIRYVDIVGNTKTKDKVIRRELYTVPGQKFSRAAIIRSLRNLANLNYFNPERLVPDVRPSADATSVDIVYEVEEHPSDTFNASLGLSSQGITGSLGLSFTNFSLTEPLSGGGGQVLSLNAEFGSYVQTYSLGLTEPWFLNKPITVGVNGFYQKQNYSYTNNSEYKIERYGASLTSGTRLSWPDDYFRLDGALRITQNNLIADSTRPSYYVNGSEYSLSIVPSRSSIDNPIFPTVGSRFKLPVVLALLGDAQYFKPEISLEFFSPLTKNAGTNKLVLYLSTEMGYLKEISETSTISPTTYYTMGGTTLSSLNSVSLRGYESGSIGPFNAGNLPAGTTSFKASAELRYPLTLNPIPIYFLGFVEAGNVWRNLGEFNPFELKRSAGLGMRIMMPPIGLLGFDYAFGFDPDRLNDSPTEVPKASGWKFHFQFGR